MTIPENLAASLDRADELLKELLTEYEACFISRSVSARAIQLTHEVCEKLNGVLDRTARRYWELYILPILTEKERKRAKVYFPITKDRKSLDSTLGRWYWKAAGAEHQALYDYLLSQQPFENTGNRWLPVIHDLAVSSKHIDLIPQMRHEEVIRTTVIGREGGTVSWGVGGMIITGPKASIGFGPSGGAIGITSEGAFFSGDVRIMGVPVNAKTQQIFPTTGVIQKVDVWTRFLIAGHSYDAAELCRDACTGTRRMVTEMCLRFGLSQTLSSLRAKQRQSSLAQVAR